MNQKVEMQRKLGFWDSSAIVVGNIIGAGIFTTSGFVASHLPNPFHFLLTWLVGGLLALAGAMTFAELGATMPHAGGDYVYLKTAYGPLWGFLTGWASFLVTFSGSIAALAVAFAGYVKGGTLTAIGAILFLTLLNLIGVSWGKWAQNLLTALKIGLILAFVILGFGVGEGDLQNFVARPLTEGHYSLFQALGLALIPVFFTYSGWNAATYVAGEIRNPSRNLPLSLLLGTGVVILLYVGINAVFVFAVHLSEMSGVIDVAHLAAANLFGDSASRWISLLIALSILGALNSMILIGPRIYYAMARDGLFFQRVGSIHPRFKTPAVSIVLQSLWATALILTGTFEQLLNYVTFVILLFSCLAGIAVFVVRHRFRKLDRPFSVWGYPWVSLLFIGVSLWIMGNVLVAKPMEALVGLGFVSLGIPVYFYWRKK